MTHLLTAEESANLIAAVAAIPAVEDDSYRLTLEYVDECLVLHMTGLVLQPVPDEFQDRVEQIMAHGGGRRVILDLSGCSYVSSAVLGVLVRFFNVSHDQAGQMVVVRPPERVERVMRAVGLDSFFLFVDSLEMALTFFRAQKS